jgi:N,N'-diacetylchitobiose transport system substrate-binding protein
MTKYMAAGAFTNITSNQGQFDNSKNWLTGMRAWGTYNKKLYGVPYYAGSRVITYRNDLFTKAGFKKPPKSLNQFQSELVKIGKMKKHVKGFSPLYVGGEDWYTALGFVFDYGGSIAKLSHGKWHGTLDSKKSLAGLKRFKAFFRATQAKRTATLDASGLGAGNPFPYTVYSQGRTAANYGPAWYTCCTGKKYTKVTKQFVMPSHTKGKPIPGFLGGSTEQFEVAGDRVDGRLHQHGERESSREEGQHPERDHPAREQRQRAGRRPQLVRPAGQALGRRRERQHHQDDARGASHGPFDRQAGRADSQSQHRPDPKRVVGNS